MSICLRSSDPKYQKRNSPPYPANNPRCRGTFRRGNDGNMYESLPNINGVYIWRRLKWSKTKSKTKSKRSKTKSKRSKTKSKRSKRKSKTKSKRSKTKSKRSKTKSKRKSKTKSKRSKTKSKRKSKRSKTKSKRSKTKSKRSKTKSKRLKTKSKSKPQSKRSKTKSKTSRKAYFNLIQRIESAKFKKAIGEIKSGTKTSHWAWWAFPTEKTGFSEPVLKNNIKTKLTPETFKLFLINLPKPWINLMQKVIEKIEEGYRVIDLFPEIDHDRINYFIIFFLKNLDKNPDLPNWKLVKDYINLLHSNFYKSKTKSKRKSKSKPQRKSKRKPQSKRESETKSKPQSKTKSKRKSKPPAQKNMKSFPVMRYKELRPREIELKPEILDKYIGWYASEKIDGWHAIWDGKGTLYTKSFKRTFEVPKSWMKLLPKIALTGEIKIKGHSATRTAILMKDSKAWEKAYFHVFDVPGSDKPFSARMELIVKTVTDACKSTKKCPLIVAKQIKMTTRKKIVDFYKKVLKKGGEGLVITNPESLYDTSNKRSHQRVKLKGRNDAEGKVVGYNLGGKRGLLRSLRVEFKGETFNLGIGFKDDQLNNYKKLFPKGTQVTFSYREMGDGGKPKEARFVRVRGDLK
jgi:DNA ligase-1